MVTACVSLTRVRLRLHRHTSRFASVSDDGMYRLVWALSSAAAEDRPITAWMAVPRKGAVAA
jgi:hypothetical protein